MQLPQEIPAELKRYEKFGTEELLLEELKQHPMELMSFFLASCQDETWSETHPLVIEALLKWLTEANLNGNFPQDYFLQIIGLIQKHIHVLKPYIPLDLLIKIDNSEYYMNSFLLGNQSYHFGRRLINECRGLKNPVLKVSEVSLRQLQLIDEFINTGIIQDLWRLQPDELWDIIDALAPLGFTQAVEACEEILRRYIDRTQVFEMLIKAHQKFLQLLQNACIEFINNLELGVHLQITPVVNLSLELSDYKENAMEILNKLSNYITHLVFSKEMTADTRFRVAINRCPKLLGLDLSESTIASDYFQDVPDRVKELYLSHCNWINNASLQTFSMTCPKLTKLDLSNNDQLTYAIWSELQRFKKLTALDISRCFQIGDNELRIILQAGPRLMEFKAIHCQKITSNGFFEIGKLLPDVSILNISRTLISDAPLIDLMTRCKNLYSLDISRCYGLSGKALLQGIKNCPSLKIINIANCGFTESDLAEIRKNAPFLNVMD